eukprot:11489663-Alexandrium_andersonii.AAC.1
MGVGFLWPADADKLEMVFPAWHQPRALGRSLRLPQRAPPARRLGPARLPTLARLALPQKGAS